MRFLMLMKPDLPDALPEGWMPPLDALTAMTAYNEELSKAGVLLALDGLHAPSAGVQVAFDDGSVSITDGPFAEAKEQIGGYWIIDVPSKESAVEWASRCPVRSGRAVIEVRQIMELSEFPPDQQAAARFAE